ncbi:MAG: STAS domain-containing protein [Kiritimatiellia bacterium]
MTNPVQFMEESRQGVTILHILDQRLIDPQLSEQLTRRLCGFIEGGCMRLLIEMGAVNRISSVFFRSFIAAGKKAKERNAQMAFCNLTPLIKEGFTITGLDKLFKIYASEGQAIGEIGE